MSRAHLKLKFGESLQSVVFGTDKPKAMAFTDVNAPPGRDALNATGGGTTYIESEKIYRPADDPTWTAEGKWFRKKAWVGLLKEMPFEDLKDKFEFNRTRPHSAVPITSPTVLKKLGPQSLDVGFRLGPTTIEPYHIVLCKAASAYYWDLSDSSNWVMFKQMMLYRARDNTNSLQDESTRLEEAYRKMNHYKLESLLDFFCRLLLTPNHSLGQSLDEIYDPEDFPASIRLMKERYMDVYKTANFLNRFAADKVKVGEPFPRILMYSRTLEMFVNKLGQGTGSFDTLPISGHFANLRHGVEDLIIETPEQTRTHRHSSKRSRSKPSIPKKSRMDPGDGGPSNVDVQVSKQTDTKAPSEKERSETGSKRKRTSETVGHDKSNEENGESDSVDEEVSIDKRALIQKELLVSILETMGRYGDGLEEVKTQLAECQHENKKLKKQVVELDKTVTVLQARKSHKDVEEKTAVNRTILDQGKSKDKRKDKGKKVMVSDDDHSSGRQSESSISEKPKGKRKVTKSSSSSSSTSSTEDEKSKKKKRKEKTLRDDKKKLRLKDEKKSKVNRKELEQIGDWLMKKLSPKNLEKSDLEEVWDNMVIFFKAKGKSNFVDGQNKDMLKNEQYAHRFRQKVMLFNLD